MVFSKASPYLKEEYALLKSGYTAEKLVNFTLIDLLKDFCEVRGIGMCDDLKLRCDCAVGIEWYIFFSESIYSK